MDSSINNDWDIVNSGSLVKKITNLENKIEKLTDVLKISIRNNELYRKENEELKEYILKTQKKHEDIIKKMLHNNEILIKSQFIHYKNKLKPLLNKIQNTNSQIKENLNSGLYKQRSDNLLWRTYSNNFLGLNSLVNPLVVSTKIIDDVDSE